MSVINGRLGNQLFRYAFARALQIKFYPDYKLFLHIGFLQNLPQHLVNEEYENSLQHFKVKHSGFCDKRLRDSRSFLHSCLVAARDRILRKILPASFLKRIDTKIFQPLFNRIGLYNAMTSGNYVRPVKSRSRRIFCNSNSINAAYFDDIRDVLLEEFTPVNEAMPENMSLLREIAACESVCVHIRRGDYLAPENVSTFHVCNEEYFVTAMKQIREELPDCKFFVFSDDIETIKSTMHLPFDAEYVSSDIPNYETLRLMYSCRHFIISNSTFSWWAQYLSRNPSKIVYVPVPWLWRSEKFEGLYLPYMRTIECHR